VVVHRQVPSFRQFCLWAVKVFAGDHPIPTLQCPSFGISRCRSLIATVLQVSVPCRVSCLSVFLFLSSFGRVWGLYAHRTLRWVPERGATVTRHPWWTSSIRGTHLFIPFHYRSPRSGWLRAGIPTVVRMKGTHCGRQSSHTYRKGVKERVRTNKQ
jgi:hypothetical protein